MAEDFSRRTRLITTMNLFEIIFKIRQLEVSSRLK